MIIMPSLFVSRYQQVHIQDFESDQNYWGDSKNFISCIQFNYFLKFSFWSFLDVWKHIFLFYGYMWGTNSTI